MNKNIIETQENFYVFENSEGTPDGDHAASLCSNIVTVTRKVRGYVEGDSRIHVLEVLEWEFELPYEESVRGIVPKLVVVRGSQVFIPKGSRK